MISSFRPLEARLLGKLALPVFLAQIAQSSMGFVDTVVAGRAGAVDMAGVALASSFWMPCLLFGQGLLMAITPLVAQNIGAGKTAGLGRFLRQGMWMALGLAILLLSALYGASHFVLTMNGVEPELAQMSSGYLRAIIWGLPGMTLYYVFRCFLEGHGRTRPAMVAGFVGVACNIPLNIIFVFGYFGLPAMGGVGCGVASAIVCWVMSFIMFLSVRKLRPGVFRFEPVVWSLVGRIGRIGLPGAFALLMETSSFALVAILIAPLGTIMVAGHQIALNFSGLLFMIPLSIGAATSIRVGTCLGEGDLKRAKEARVTALAISFSMAVLTGLFLYLARYPIARIYSDNVPVIQLAGYLMAFAAVYQISDACQVSTMAALRGYNDTKAIFFMTFISYWIIALPLGYVLGLTDLLVPRMGAAGFWVGIIAGLTSAAILLLLRLNRLEKLSLEEVRLKISR